MASFCKVCLCHMCETADSHHHHQYTHMYSELLHNNWTLSIIILSMHIKNNKYGDRLQCQSDHGRKEEGEASVISVSSVVPYVHYVPGGY